jgi:hypothetical protein
VTEWFLNEPQGIEHGFDILEPLGAGESDVELRVAVWGSLLPSLGRDGRGLSLRDRERHIVLHYDGLQAFDAAGRQLTSRLALDRRQLVRIRVNVSGAAYPIVVN